MGPRVIYLKVDIFSWPVLGAAPGADSQLNMCIRQAYHTQLTGRVAVAVVMMLG